MKINHIFSDFMGENILKNINNPSLKTFILNLKKKDKGRVISNYGGWQSNEISLQEDVLKELLGEIQQNLVSLEKVLCLRNEFKLKVDSLWANVSGSGASNIPHLHFRSILSGVYYITHPKNSGSLRLMNPNLFNHVSLVHMGKMETFVKNPTPFTTYETEFVGLPGSLVIFPSHLCHYVLPNLSKEARISISFNTTLEKK